MKKILLIAACLTMLASCGAKEPTTVEHTVTFEYNCTMSDGTTKTTQKVKDGEKANVPDLERTGWTLEGWFKDNNVWAVAFNPSEAIKADLTVYAKWVSATIVTAEEYTAAISNDVLKNARYDLVQTIASLTIEGYCEQEDNKAYAYSSMSGVSQESYLEVTSDSTFVYSKDNTGKWTKSVDASSKLPSVQYSSMLAAIQFNQLTYNTEEGVYSVSEQGTTVEVKFNNKKLVGISLTAGQISQIIQISKYGECKVTLPTV